jgi:hypothetical protein
MNKRRFIHNCLMNLSFKRKTSRNDFNAKIKEEIIFLNLDQVNSFENLTLVFLNEFHLIYTLIKS